jgi:phosphoribosylglycinamide formyltransferase 1
MKLKTAVLLSGGGRTLQNLIDRPDLPITISLVLSSSADAYGLERAKAAGIPTAVVNRKRFPSHETYSNYVFGACRDADAQLILLAGFLKLLRPIPRGYEGRVLNIHPSLIPAFCGKGLYGSRVHKAVLEAKATETGCTVHVVDDEYDHGPIVLQRTVPVEPGDDADTLAARVFAAECEAYPDAIRTVVGQLEQAGP